MYESVKMLVGVIFTDLVVMLRRKENVWWEGVAKVDGLRVENEVENPFLKLKGEPVAFCTVEGAK